MLNFELYIVILIAIYLNTFVKTFKKSDMKNLVITALMMFFASCWTLAQTSGTLTVTATTSSTGGNYAPKKIVAMWIEDEQGNWVKTLLAYAATRKTHLNTWEAATTEAGSPFNTVDAITGATRSSHATRTCTWNGTGVDGTLVPDGNYKVWMELTDKNGTGNFSSFPFTKDTNAQNLTPLNVPSFGSISITWEPVLTGVGEHALSAMYSVYPNPTTGVFRVIGEHIDRIEVLNVAGGLITESKTTKLDISAQPDGVYYVRIHTAQGMAVKKVMKYR